MRHAEPKGSLRRTALPGHETQARQGIGYVFIHLFISELQVLLLDCFGELLSEEFLCIRPDPLLVPLRELEQAWKKVRAELLRSFARQQRREVVDGHDG